MKSTTIAVDVAKTVFEVAVSEHPGHVRNRLDSRANGSGDTLAEQPAATLLMEACGSAHYWGRQAQGLGHQVVLLPPHGYGLTSRPIGPTPRDCWRRWATTKPGRCPSNRRSSKR
jgi:hypothetical protein